MRRASDRRVCGPRPRDDGCPEPQAPSPLDSGQTPSWAASVLYALGQANFLFDEDDETHRAATHLCDRVGITQSIGPRYARKIRDDLDLKPFNPDWTLASKVDENPMAWMIPVNGMLVDARDMPKEVQEEAARKDLTPYVPS